MISEQAEALKLHRDQNVAVISHVRPDADCIGSQVALCRWLKDNSVRAFAFNDDPLPPNLKWLAHLFPVRKTDLELLNSCEAFVFVDGNDPSRFGLAGSAAAKSGKKLYMIDHHPQPADIYEVAISDVKASSTCELVYGLFETSPDLLDLGSAEAIYAGIMTDTGSFSFDSVSARTHAVVASLMTQTGMRTHEVHQRIFSGKPLAQLKLLSKVLGQIELHQNGKIATLSVTKELLRETGSEYHHLEGMVNYGLGVEGVQAAILFCELDDKIKMSLRSNSQVDVNILARKFNGGGHVKAAGGWHPGPMEKAIAEVVAEGAVQLK